MRLPARLKLLPKRNGWSVIIVALAVWALVPTGPASGDQAAVPSPPALTAKPKLEVVAAAKPLELKRGRQMVANLLVRNVSGGDLSAEAIHFKFKPDEGGNTPDIAKPQVTGLENVTLKDKAETAICLWFPAYEKNGEYSGELYLKLSGTESDERFHSFKMMVQEPSPSPLSKQWSAIYAVVFGIFVVLIAWLVRRKTKRSFLQSPDGAYSVSRFQVFVWTVVIIFSYTYLYFRTGPGIVFPENILYLLGISVGSLGAAKIIATNKQENVGGGVALAPPPTPAGGAGAGRLAPAQPGAGVLASMLSDDGSPSLMRWQMFIWTIATAAFFLRQTFATNCLWQVPSGLLVLMGISHGGYLVDKGAAAKTDMKVQSLQPKEVTRVNGTYGQTPLVIVGLNFDPVAVSCLLGGVALNLTSKSSTKLEATLPANALPVGKHDLVVQQPGEDAEVMKDGFEVK